MYKVLDIEYHHAPMQKRTSFTDSKNDSNSRTLRKSSQQDVHNEYCHICNDTGKLLCCDTCSLVFHLTCLRPKLSAIPSGDWSCAYCKAEVSYMTYHFQYLSLFTFM